MFKFRLASIKKLKEYIEKQCKDEFARCLTNLYLAQEQQRRTEENIKFMEEEISGMQQGVLNLPNLIISQDYLSFLHEELVRQKQVVAEKKEELEIARSKLMEAMKNRKIMDKLEEKQYQQYIYEQDKKEQALLDDFAGRR
ncbi:MAG: flagellar export protein FliJ [Peptococcia bacterium]